MCVVCFDQVQRSCLQIRRFKRDFCVARLENVWKCNNQYFSVTVRKSNEDFRESLLRSRKKKKKKVELRFHAMHAHSESVSLRKREKNEFAPTEIAFEFWIQKLKRKKKKNNFSENETSHASELVCNISNSFLFHNFDWRTAIAVDQWVRRFKLFVGVGTEIRAPSSTSPSNDASIATPTTCEIYDRPVIRQRFAISRRWDASQSVEWWQTIWQQSTEPKA